MSSNPFIASTTIAAPNGESFRASATIYWDSNYYVTITDLWCELDDGEWTWRVTGSYSAGDTNTYASENSGKYSFQGSKDTKYVWGACIATSNTPSGTWTNDNGVFTLTSGSSSGGDEGDDEGGSGGTGTYRLLFNKNNTVWDEFPDTQYWPAEWESYLPTATRAPTTTTTASYNITGNANGGSPNTSFTVNKVLTKSYSGSWNTNPLGTGTRYAFGAKYCAESHAAFYAQQTSSETESYENNNISNLPIPSNPPSPITETINVYFNTNGGFISGIESKSVTKTISYSFDRWTTDQYGYNDPPILFNSDTVLYAQWAPNVNIPSVSLPVQGTKDGYTFRGWALSNNSDVVYNNTYTPSADVTLYAVWEPNYNTPYLVNHYIQDLNTTTYSLYNSENKTGYTDEAINISNIIAPITGFTFKEAKSNGSVVNSIIISADGNTSVDVYYTRNSYNLNVNKSNNILSVKGSGTYQYGEDVTISATYSEVYHFTGWTGTITNQNNPASFSMPDKDITLTANCEINTYTIKFDGNGHTSGQYMVSIPDVSCIAEIQLPVNTYKKNNFTFNGWNTEPDSSGVHYDDQGYVASLSLEHDDIVTLYAEWIGAPCTISFNMNGGSGGPSDGGKEYNKDYIIPNIIPTLKGHQFQGWGIEQGSDIVMYRPGDTYDSNEDITLYAIWKIGMYTNTINHLLTGFIHGEGNNENGNCFILKTETFMQEYNTSFTLTETNTLSDIPNGFQLNNTCTVISSENTNTYLIGENIIQSESDLTINIYYDPVSFKITYILNDGTNNINNPKTYNILYPVILSNATKYGFRQLGWFDNDGNKITEINSGATSSFVDIDTLYRDLSNRVCTDITLTARWQALGVLNIPSADGTKKDKYKCGIYLKGKWITYIPYRYNKTNNTWDLVYD